MYKFQPTSIGPKTCCKFCEIFKNKFLPNISGRLFLLVHQLTHYFSVSVYNFEHWLISQVYSLACRSFQVSVFPARRYFFKVNNNRIIRTLARKTPNPIDTAPILSVHKTFRRRPGRLLNVMHGQFRSRVYGELTSMSSSFWHLCC